MANTHKFKVKNGLEGQNISFVDDIENPNNSITVSMLTNDVLSFSGNSGQLFSISDDLTGTIFAVNDVSGIPAIEVDDDGTIRFAESFGNVLIGTNVDDGTNKLQVTGNMAITGDILNGGDGNRIRFMYGTTNSQPSIGVGEQGTYGFAMRWDSGSELDFDGWWNSSVTGAANRDLGSVNVDTRVWNFHNDVQVNGNSVLTTASTIGSATNADTVDSLHASSFIRSDADDSFSGRLTGTNGGTVYSTSTPTLHLGKAAAGNAGLLITNQDGDAHTWFSYTNGSNYITADADGTDGATYIRSETGGTYANIAKFSHGGDTFLYGDNLYFDGSSTTHLHSDNVFQFLTDNGNAQVGKFRGLQVSTNYSGTVPDNGILFGTDTTIARAAANNIDANGTVRITSQGTAASTGAGMELRYTTGNYSSVLSYNRGGGSYQPLYLEGSAIHLREAGTSVLVADGNKVKIMSDQVGARLHVYDSAAASSRNGSGTPTTVQYLAARTDASGEGPSLDFASVWQNQASTYNPTSWNNGWVVARVAGIYDSTVSNGGALTFYTSEGTSATGGSTYSGLKERMRISPEGNVGIGTVSPVDTFEVHGTTGQLFSITDELTGTIFSVNDVSGVPAIEVDDQGDVFLARYTGNLIVGNATNPTEKLYVVGDIASTLDITSGGSITGTTLGSTVADGTSPLSITSTTNVTNLSADYVDGLHASQFLRSDTTDTASGQITFTNKVIVDHNTGPMFTVQATNGSPWAIDLGRDDATNSKVYNGGGYWNFEHLPRWYNGNNTISLATQKDIARSLGWVPGYNSSDEYSVLWNNTEDAVELYSGSDTGIGAIHQAVFIPSGQKVRFSVMVKGSASSTSGLYLRLYAYNGTSLPNGKTHVSNDTAGGSSALVQEDSSGDTGWTENQAVPSGWTTYSREYTAGQDVMVSLVVLNWSGFSGSLYIKQPTIDIVKVADAEKLDGVNGASYLRSDADDTYTGDLTHIGGAVFGSGTLSANGANDIFFFASSPTSGVAQSGNFNNKVRILGGSGQSRDLQLWQVPSGYSYIGSSWTSNRLYFDSSYTFSQHNHRVIVNEAQNTTAQTNPHLHLKASSTTNSTGLTAIRLDTSTVDNYGITLAGARKGTDGTPTFSIRTHNNSAGGNEVFTIDNAGRTTIKSTGIGNNTVHPALTLDTTFDVATIDGDDEIAIAFSVTNNQGGNQTQSAITFAYNDVLRLNYYGSSTTTYIGSKGTYFSDTSGSASSLGRISSISFARGDNSGNWDQPGNHGIRSTDGSGNWGDDISINSYHDITLRLDSNSNNNDGYVRIMNNTTGNSTIHYMGHNGTNPISAFSGLLQVGDTSTPAYTIDTAANGSTTDTNKLRFGINNGDAGGTTNAVGTGIVWAPKYTGYTKTSAGILQIGEGNYFRSGLAFYTNNTADTSTAMVERMRIDMDGNVGIGVAEPLDKFEVHGTNGQLFSVQDSFTGTIFSVNDGSGVPSIEVDDTGVIRLAEFSGNVLIGTASDDGANLLQVDGSIRQVQTTGGDGGFVLREWTGGSSYASLVTNGMSGSEYVVISNGTDTYISSGSGGTTYIRGPANDSSPEIRVTSTTASVSGNRILTTADEGTGNGLDADTVDGIQGASLLRSDTTDTFKGGDLYIGDGTDNSRILIQKLDNTSSDHIIFYNTTTRTGEIGSQDTTWLRINQQTSKNVYTPRYLRADGGLYVDSTSYGINGSGRLLSASFSGTYSNSIAFSNSYNSFGNDAGNTTYNNTGSWNGRLNVIGTQHARIDAVSASDGIITTMYAHTGHGVGRVGTTSNHPIAFMVNGAIEAQLSDAGFRVGDGTNGNAVYSSAIFLGYSGSHSVSTNYNGFIDANAAGIMRFYTRNSGTNTLGMTLTNGDLLVAGNVQSYSDAKLKANVKTIENSLDKVMNMRGVNYNRLDLDDKYDAGVIAQEMQEVAPELVTENEEHLSVNYNGISGYLIEAMKEQQKLIESLTKKVEELEAKLNKE